MSDQDYYAKRGVSSGKEEVHKAVKVLDEGVFPGAFCRAVPDILTGDPERVMLIHADGAGTKSSLAWLYYKETGDRSVFRGVAQDALVMNIDDLLCVGVAKNYLLASAIGRNKHLVEGDVIKEIIAGTQKLCDHFNEYGANITFCGGETADVGDLVKTLIVDATVTTSIKKQDFIHTQNIKPGKVIVGLASFGQTTYEDKYNSGIGSNGLTNARHDVFSDYYRDKYPDSYDKHTDSHFIYSGTHRVEDPLEGTGLNMGQAVLSPTRSFFPIMKEVFDKHRSSIDAVIHNTGGGQTKCLKFGSNIHFVKDNLIPFPPLFRLLSQSTPMEQMFRVYNCGTRMEIYTDEKTAESIIDISKQFNCDAQIIGRTVENSASSNTLEILYNGEKYEY